ncbi:MAG TPA: Uma2 family endonuclease [Polyangiaceae bacterium]|nr:Uma2 family endonuclease [Polyangiaceae bacterium]
MSNPARRLATYEDLRALGPDVRAEIIDGEVAVAPSPSPLHQGAVGGVHAELRSPFQRGRGGPGGWWLILDVDVFFGPHDILRPDIAGWRHARVPGYPTERSVRVTPDWVCEALSPTTAARDQGDKRIIYQRANVPWYWIIDPSNRSLQVYRLTPDGYLLDTSVGDRGLARLRPFEAVELELDALFPEVGSASG